MRVICESGIEGWQGYIQDVYEDLGELKTYDSIYNIAERLGYNSVLRLLNDNPLVQGSVVPSDFKVVKV